VSVERAGVGAVCAAVLVLAGLAVGAVTAAGNPARQLGRVGVALSPPVITEHFKPILACNPNTTVGMEGCGEHKVLAVDRRLNADAKLIFGLLRPGVSRRDFVSAQTEWLSYRNADCRSQSDVYSGGTEQPVLYVLCLAADDDFRRQDLKGFFATLTQGQEHAPTFP
jgi:uncharacterized protein YecT (DUF1311 family)